MTNKHKKHDHGSIPEKRLPYEPPAIDLEQLFEITGLGCGKCPGLAPTGGSPCDSSDSLS